MGNVTLESGIWTPDEDDAVDPDVWSAQMADSIEQGIGKRLADQEQYISASIHLPFGEDITLESAQAIPYQVTSASYADELVVQNGHVTIEVDGLYFLTSRATFSYTPGYLMTLEIRETPFKTLARGHGSTVNFGASTVGYISIAEVRRLYKGDQVFCCLIDYSNGATPIVARASGDIDSNNFSVTLLKPIPVL